MMRLNMPFPGRRFLGNRAIAAVEFALCVPVLLLLFVGTIELFLLYRTEAKLSALTSSYAQMVAAQQPNAPYSTVSTGTPGLTDLCQGAVYGLQPFPPHGLTIDVASVTVTAAATTKTSGGKTTSVPATYSAWEVDMNNNCAPTKTVPAIGATGATGALTIATGGGTPANAMVQGPGDNIIIVKATLQYPGLLGVFIKTAPTLQQTAVARWGSASPTNVSSAPVPSNTLQLLCSGTGCVTYTCSSSTSCSS